MEHYNLLQLHFNSYRITNIMYIRSRRHRRRHRRRPRRRHRHRRRRRRHRHRRRRRPRRRPRRRRRRRIEAVPSFILIRRITIALHAMRRTWSATARGLPSAVSDFLVTFATGRKKI